MRKSALLLAAVMAVTAPSLAVAAKKKSAPAPAAGPVAAPANNDNGMKLVSAGFSQLFVPFNSMTGTTKTAAAEPVVSKPSKRTRRGVSKTGPRKNQKIGT